MWGNRKEISPFFSVAVFVTAMVWVCVHAYVCVPYHYITAANDNYDCIIFSMPHAFLTGSVT